MEEEIREMTPEPKPDINPLEYVTIPIREYRKLIKKVEQLKAMLVESEKVTKLTEDRDKYERWWNDERKQSEDLAEQLTEAHRLIKQYKADYEKLLGIDELKKAQLAELSFEKGVNTDDVV